MVALAEVLASVNQGGVLAGDAPLPFNMHQGMFRYAVILQYWAKPLRTGPTVPTYSYHKAWQQWSHTKSRPFAFMAEMASGLTSLLSRQ